MSGADSGKSLEAALFGDRVRRAGGEGAERARLRDYEWDVSYSHEDGDLVSMFFVPTLYQRATGYFAAGVLAMAARGLDKLIERGGRMELLVGCTLGPEEVEQIQQGYDVREAVKRSMLNRLAMDREDSQARERLGYLTWMIAHGHLDVKVAIPKDADGRFRAGLGLYHSKVGIVTDDAGDVLVFKGSINETPAGWQQNTEDFDVNCSWVGGSDRMRVEKATGDFAKLWAGQARSTAVMDLPEAVKQELMRYLPKDATFVAPPPEPEAEDPSAGEAEEAGGTKDDAEESDEHKPQQTLEERRAEVWTFLKEAPARADGALVAVETAAVVPWPHQLRAYKRMLDAWPFRLLIADEVGLGKTIEAGMILRHAWISGLAKRILILTPAGVMRQWQAELYEKFNLRVPMYTGSKLVWPDYHGRVGELERPVDRDAWTAEPLVLASSHLVRRKERQRELIDAEDWDLLVLDEAHHARRRGPGTAQEGGPNRLLRLMQEIGPKAKSLLMMTATPMQVHPVELWDLLSVLGLPEAWNRHAFIEYFEKLAKNPDHETLHQLSGLFRASEAVYGPVSAAEVKPIAENVGVASEIGQKKVLTALRDGKSTIPLKRLSTSHRKLAVGVLRSMSPIQRLMSRHTRNLLRRYHEAGLLSSPIAHREPIDEPALAARLREAGE
ncbi:MAG: SNF2-related protein, partial [Gemmatimonadota bacterium]